MNLEFRIFTINTNLFLIISICLFWLFFCLIAHEINELCCSGSDAASSVTLVSINVPPITLSDWLHVTSHSLQTLQNMTSLDRNAAFKTLTSYHNTTASKKTTYSLISQQLTHSQTSDKHTCSVFHFAKSVV